MHVQVPYILDKKTGGQWTVISLANVWRCQGRNRK